MAVLEDPQVWLSFITLSVLEIVLGIDNIIFLSLLVERLPPARRRSARLLGLGFAMLTRIALLFTITWLAGLSTPLFSLLGQGISGRELILGAGGAFLVFKSVKELRAMRAGPRARRTSGRYDRFWLVIVQIAVVDIVFSLDTVFTAVGLSNHIGVMVAAIVASVAAMMVVSGTVSAFIDRYPSLKTLALAFMVLVGGALITEAFEYEVPRGYLYFAMAFSAAVEWLNLGRGRRRGP